MLSLLQTAAMTAELEALQAQAMQVMQQAQETGAMPYAMQDMSLEKAAPLAFGLMIAMVLVSILGIIMGIINLLNIYHWGMTDKAVFQTASEDKKKWFYILLIVPLVATLIMIIPLIGWVVGAIIYIYWIVMSLKYFFGQRIKLS